MKNIFLFDIKSYIRNYVSWLVVLLMIAMGFFAGSKFNLSVGDGVYLNSPYSIGFMTGLFSLSVIFIGTILAVRLLFREWDARFDGILFSMPVNKAGFAAARYFALCLLTFLLFALLVLGFAWGEVSRTGVEMNPQVSISYYLYPLLVFGFVNTLFTCSVLVCIAWTTQKKLLVTIGGLLLYVLYMVILVFSNAPFMAASSPQSLDAQQLAAFTDPFGISAYFFVSRDLTAVQRNEMLVPFSGLFMLNRILFTTLSALLFFAGYKCLSITGKGKAKRKSIPNAVNLQPVVFQEKLIIPHIHFSNTAFIRAAISFAKKDLIYLFKSIALAAVSVLLLFNAGMEMYAAIEKGIRLPQKYASSGLMASAISDSFQLPVAFVIVYFVNDLCWRSKASGFSLIEQSTFLGTAKKWGHWLSATVFLCFLSMILILEGLVFQLGYRYFHVSWNAYAGVFIFNTLPLILLAGLMVMVNRINRNRYVALALSLLVVLLLASPATKQLIRQPLLYIFSGAPVKYSDLNGYGSYLPVFLYRLVFGAACIGLLWWLGSKKRMVTGVLSLIVLTGIGAIAANRFLDGYRPVGKTALIEHAVNYEKKYRRFQSVAQPVISDVVTSIDLFPEKDAYTIKGHYILKNKSNTPIDSILLNFHRDLHMDKAVLTNGTERVLITEPTGISRLKYPLLPGDSAVLKFELSYEWHAVNGHQPFNAIVGNGSFIRISRYYPQIGYQQDDEAEDKNIRKSYGLGTASGIKQLGDPFTFNNFINLDMTVSTSPGQTAIGTGELLREWMQSGRHYFRYRPDIPVPFRFAVSSAVYERKTEIYKGIGINVFYHPAHAENVAHLLTNTKNTLDYCITEFGPFPFRSVTFAEVSSFTRGIAATAYPAAIFMPEDMVFHANIHGDKQQDVINELAGHELSHFWWGNSSISPDDREGAPMLTETLAMYTEMMLYKKMYGKEKMKERLAVHRQIYESEKGFTAGQPLYKVTGASTHISYSKGAMVMVQLSELIGEEKVNEALRDFLQQFRYPARAPVSTDLINAVLKVSDAKYHGQIRDLFEKE